MKLDTQILLSFDLGFIKDLEDTLGQIIKKMSKFNSTLKI